jgi:hypothetical protein
MITIDGVQVRAFADQLRDFPREYRKDVRRSIKKAADVLVRDIKGNAAWSSRIPAATKTKVNFGARSAGVLVFVDAKKAPHARPLEFGNKPGFNRHPVFGNRENWVDQPVRPFFIRAVRSNERQVVDAVQQAINDAWPR